MAEQKINIKQVVSYLNHAFSRAQNVAMQRFGRSNVKGTTIHKYQVEFCYLIDDIQRSPQYIVPKRISAANELIAALELETEAKVKVK